MKDTLAPTNINDTLDSPTSDASNSPTLGTTNTNDLPTTYFWIRHGEFEQLSFLPPAELTILDRLEAMFDNLESLTFDSFFEDKHLTLDSPYEAESPKSGPQGRSPETDEVGSPETLAFLVFIIVLLVILTST